MSFHRRKPESLSECDTNENRTQREFQINVTVGSHFRVGQGGSNFDKADEPFFSEKQAMPREKWFKKWKLNT